MQGPHFLNVLRVLDVPQALAMAAERRVQSGGALAQPLREPARMGTLMAIETAKSLR